MAICGDFSWPFKPILTWPLTGEWRHNVCLNLLGRRSGAGTFANLEFRPYGNAITLEIPCDFDNRVVTAIPE
jgi:hypothetical protein